MALNEIKVGTQVRLLREIPSERIVSSNINHDPRFWSKAKLKLKGKAGVVTDVLQSSTFGCTVYRVHLDGKKNRAGATLSRRTLSPTARAL